MNSVRLGVVASVLVGCLGACGSNVASPDPAGTPIPEVSESTSTSSGSTAKDSDEAPTVPRTDELAAALLTPAVLGEGWEVLEDVAAGEIHGPGNFCHDSQNEYGEWFAEAGMVYGRDLEQAHWLMLGQRLTCGEPERMHALFDEIKSAMEACDGAEWVTIEEGHLQSALMDVPSIGEEGVGLYVHSDGFEAADGVTVVEDGQQAAILDGSVLMFTSLVELREQRLDPVGTEVDFTEILTTAVERLPG